MITATTNIRSIRKQAYPLWDKIERCTNDKNVIYVNMAARLDPKAVDMQILYFRRMGYKLVTERQTEGGTFLTFSFDVWS